MPRRKSKAGRPPLGADKRSVRIRASVTPELAAQIEAAADREQRDVPDWAVAAFELAIARGSTR